MARSLAILNSDGTVTCRADWLAERIAKRLEGKRPGVYRMRFTGDRSGRVYVDPGRRVASARRELARLRALGAEAAQRGHTGMPGVAGYQQRADAASGSAHNAKALTRELADWLEANLRAALRAEKG